VNIEDCAMVGATRKSGSEIEIVSKCTVEEQTYKRTYSISNISNKTLSLKWRDDFQLHFNSAQVFKRCE
jgi:hypothetical protein